MVRPVRGFTYLAALFAVAILAGGLALAGQMWETATRRDREAEALFTGHQYRLAIERYYFAPPQRQYPASLEDLLKDRRQAGTERYLRTLYPDPITGKPWVPIMGPQGGIIGVRSASEEKPLKIAGFKIRDAAFEGASKYADWQFVFQPRQTVPVSKPAAPGKPGPSASAR